MKLSRIIAALLAVVMLCASLIACAQETGDTTTTPVVTEAPLNTEDATVNTESAGTEAETVAIENLSQNGQALQFNMLVRPNRYAYLYVEDQNGEMLNDSVFKRNQYLEETYGIDLTITEAGEDSAAGFTTKISSGEAAYDLVCFDYWWNLELNGYFANILDMTEIDTTDCWWYSGWNNNVTINGKMYSIAGDANLEMLENLEVMFFNKNMAKDRNLDLYKTVSDGKWTVDALIETVSSVTSGLDDTDTTNDVYGVMYDVHSNCAQLYSCGLQIATVEDGAVSLENAVSQKNLDVADKLVTLMKTNGVYYQDKTARAADWTLFKNNQSLIYATALYLGKSLKNGELGFDYGIIPAPKLTEDSSYVSTSYGVSVFAIPNTVNSKHNSALILNAMNYKSGRTDDSVVTTFYEIVLKYQVANSLEDINNLDIIKNNIYIDFAFIYDVGLNSSYKTMVSNKSISSSGLKATLKTAQKTLDKIISFYNS